MSHVLGEPYQLAYAIPLLVFSLPITFAGAFLTLDRTRTFTPTSTGISKRSRGPWQFQGGVGGMLGGWALGGESKAVVITSTLTPDDSAIIFSGSTLINTPFSFHHE